MFIVASAEAEAKPPAAIVVDADSAATAEQASVIAQEHDHPVEIKDEQTATSTTYLNPDGTRTAELHELPIRTRQEDGSLKTVDLTLTEQTDGSVAPKNGPFDAVLSGGGNDDAVSVQTGTGQSLGLDWNSDLPKPTILENTATYRLNAARDLVLTVTRTGFNAHIVLRKAPTADTDFTFPLDLKRLRAAQTAGGRFVIEEGDGSDVAKAQPFVMWDAQRDEAGDPSNVREVEGGFVNDGSEDGSLVLSPSMEWLQDPSTQYPVVIDPDITLGQDGDTFVAEGSSAVQSTSYRLNVGTSPSACCEQVTYMNWNTAPIAGALVSSATVKMFQYWAPSCTAKQVNHHPLNDNDSNPNNDNFPVSSMVWSNRPSLNTSIGGTTTFNRGASGCSDSNTATNVNINATSTVAAWASGAITNAGLALNVPNASAHDVAFEKRFCSMNSPDYSSNPAASNYNSVCNNTAVEPRLEVNYAVKPNVPTGVKATALSDGTAASVTWTAPYNGGSSITAYRVLQTPGDVEYLFSGAGTTQTITGLDSDLTYQFKIRAVNAAGIGAYSSLSPGWAIEAFAEAGDADAEVTWISPDVLPSGGFTVTASPGGSTVTVAADADVATVPNLNNGTSYTFTIRSNSGSNSAVSVATESVLPTTLPSPIPAANVSATPVSGGQATVSWTPPSYDGGSPIIGYVVETTDGSGRAEVDAPATSAVVSNLTDGATYTFAVTALNENNSSLASAVDTEELAEEQVQGALIAAADELTGVDLEVAPADLAGFAGVRLDVAAKKLVVYWKGTPAASAMARVSPLPVGFSVQPVAAESSLAELQQKINGLKLPDGGLGDVPGMPGVQLTSISPSADGSGLVVTYIGDGVSTPAVEAVDDAMADELEVQVTSSVASAPQGADSRIADSGGRNGGSQIINPGGLTTCTAAFGVWIDKSLSARNAYLKSAKRGRNGFLTATHCGRWGTWTAPGTGNEVGTGLQWSPDYDATLVLPMDKKRVPPRSIFWGDWETKQKKRIYGATGMYVGQRVCTSGSKSGRHCNLEVTQTNVTSKLSGTGVTLVAGVYATQMSVTRKGKNTNDFIAIAGGDSGGPVVTMVGPKAYGVGTISGGSTASIVDCKNVRPSQIPSVCYRTTLISPLLYSPSREMTAEERAAERGSLQRMGLRIRHW